MAGAEFHDTAKALGLVALSVMLLPVSLAILALGQLSHMLFWFPPPPKEALSDQGPRRTILVTGVSMSKGLTLARVFHAAGHRVVGADVEAGDIPCPGRFSSSLAAFYRLPSPSVVGADAYTARLVDIARANGVDLWVSCSGVASAAEDAAAKAALELSTRCRCVQFGGATTTRLHEKDAFAAAVAALGLPGPETHAVASAGALLALLDAARQRNPTRRFLLKPIGVDDAHRGDLTLLPLVTLTETEAHVRARLPAREGGSDGPPAGWIAQQFVPGGAEYCSHALVVRGAVRAFVACPSKELLMHYEALPADSALSRAMLAFTREFVARSRAVDGTVEEAWTGHLSFDFMVADGEDDDGAPVDAAGFRRRLYAIECNPRAHTSVVLFTEDATTTRALVRAYLSVLEDDDEPLQGGLTNGEPPLPPVVTPPGRAVPRYWVAHDLAALLLQPAWSWATGRTAGMDLVAGLVAFGTHVLTWQEGTWTPADPMPALALYHVYWPLTILKAWWEGRRWSRVNVSTTKMFMC